MLGIALRRINEERNAIVHRGEFRSGARATEVINSAKSLIERLVSRYEGPFKLPPPPSD
jgi:hypothetical protein